MISMTEMLRQAAEDTAQSQSKPPIKPYQTLFSYTADYIDKALDILEHEYSSRFPSETNVREELERIIRTRVDNERSNKKNRKVLDNGRT